jgi:hypothetical protein
MSCQDVRPTPHFFSSLSEQRKRDAEWKNIVDLSGLGATGALGGAGLEAVREAAVDVAEGAHAAGAGGLAALGLLTPVDCCIRKFRVSRCIIWSRSNPPQVCSEFQPQLLS